jgi:hypothetical protein
VGPGPIPTELGLVLFKWVGLSQRVSPFNLFLLLTSFLVNSKAPVSKIQITILLTPTLFKFGKLMDKFQGNKLPFWPNFQIRMDFELKVQETNQISNLLEF